MLPLFSCSTRPCSVGWKIALALVWPQCPLYLTQCWFIHWSALKAYYKDYQFLKNSELWLYEHATIMKKWRQHSHSFLKTSRSMKQQWKGKHVYYLCKCWVTTMYFPKELWVYRRVWGQLDSSQMPSNMLGNEELKYSMCKIIFHYCFFPVSLYTD